VGGGLACARPPSVAACCGAAAGRPHPARPAVEPARARPGPPEPPKPHTHPCARSYIPELLPKFVGLLGDAERTGAYDLVRPALGLAVEGHRRKQQQPWGCRGLRGVGAEGKGGVEAGSVG
jgi:hypothetical protein